MTGPVASPADAIAVIDPNSYADWDTALDVFDQEPPPANNPLLQLDNVVLTAHFAGPTSDNHVARFRNAFDNIQRVARGEPPLWVVPELQTRL